MLGTALRKESSGIDGRPLPLENIILRSRWSTSTAMAKVMASSFRKMSKSRFRLLLNARRMERMDFRRITRKRPECCVEFFATALTCGLCSCCCAVNLVPFLDEWQQDFNQQVLSEKGIYIKIRSHGMRSGPDGIGNQRYLCHLPVNLCVRRQPYSGAPRLEPNSGYTNQKGFCIPICGTQKDAPIMIQKKKKDKLM